MVNEVTGQSELALLGRCTANAIDRGRVVRRYIVRVLETQLGPERDRAAYPEIKPHQMLGVLGLASGSLALDVVDVLIADGQRAVVVIELVLDVVNDGPVRSETMRCQRIALRPIGSGEQRRAGNLTCIGANIRIGPIADARAQPIT